MATEPVKTLLLSFQGRGSRKNTCLGRGGEDMVRMKADWGGAWGGSWSQANLGRLSLTSSSPTFHFYIPTPLSFLVTKLTWQKELRLWKQTNYLQKWAWSGIDTQNVLNEWKGPSFFCRRDILFPLPLRRSPFLCLYYGNNNATSRAM